MPEGPRLDPTTTKREREREIEYHKLQSNILVLPPKDCSFASKVITEAPYLHYEFTAPSGHLFFFHFIV